MREASRGVGLKGGGLQANKNPRYQEAHKDSVKIFDAKNCDISAIRVCLANCFGLDYLQAADNERLQ